MSNGGFWNKSAMDNSRKDLVETLIGDIRYGVRALLKQPAFTIIAVITLAFGIGSNTITFSLVNPSLLRRLPYKDPDRPMQLLSSW
jgi:hypothetical protein